MPVGSVTKYFHQCVAMSLLEKTVLLASLRSKFRTHMNFVRRTEASQGQLNTSPRENNPKKRFGVLPISQPGPSKMPKVATSYFIPKSLSVVEIPKLGKTIKKTSTSSQLKTSTCRQWFGHVPDLLKQSIINPLPKVSPPQEIQSDLRPISLTCTLAKKC